MDLKCNLKKRIFLGNFLLEYNKQEADLLSNDINKR